MTKRSWVSALSAVGLVSIASLGCGSKSEPSQEITPSKSSLTRVTDPQVSEADQATLAADNAGFALDAYHKIAAEKANLVFSPASVSIALSMAYAGAAGITASEMAAALHFSLPAERLFPAFNSLDLNLASRGQGKKATDGGPMQVKIVNAAWAERTYQFRSEFLDTLASNFGAGINLLDFVKNWEPARITINDWVSDQTNDRIKDLLPEGSLDTMTRLVLTNAVYLNAAWKDPFDPTDTRDGTFTLLAGSPMTTKFMGAHVTAPAVKGDGFSAVALPYDDERLSMLLLVPDAGTFGTFESSLDASKLGSIVAASQVQPVSLRMPRFRTETSQEFVAILESLGVHAAFQPGNADFSGMDGSRELYISEVVHKAFIDVGEKGTEAAAATAVVTKGLGIDAPTDISIVADRPFIYVLRDQPTGAILFMGRVLDPSKS